MSRISREGISYAIGAGLLVFLFWHAFPAREKKDEIIVHNIHIDRKPCVSEMNALLGKGADSTKICNCLIPQFYDLIKNDPELVSKFENSAGFFQLDGVLKDSLNALMATCIHDNVLDTNYMFKFSPGEEESLKDMLRGKLILRKYYQDPEASKISSCVVERVNGHITISRIFSKGFWDSPEITQMVDDCKKQDSQ